MPILKLKFGKVVFLVRWNNLVNLQRFTLVVYYKRCTYVSVKFCLFSAFLKGQRGRPRSEQASLIHPRKGQIHAKILQAEIRDVQISDRRSGAAARKSGGRPRWEESSRSIWTLRTPNLETKEEDEEEKLYHFLTTKKNSSQDVFIKSSEKQPEVVSLPSFNLILSFCHILFKTWPNFAPSIKNTFHVSHNK